MRNLDYRTIMALQSYSPYAIARHAVMHAARPAQDSEADGAPEASSKGVKMMPESGAAVRRLPFLSVPAWDISDEEISEWKQTPGMRFAAYTAECIRDGQYDNGQEIYPPESGVYKELSRATVDKVMEVLADRGMARKSGSAWRAVTPGRMEPSALRAVAVLLARRADLPPALAAELGSWKLTLDSLEAPDDTLASQAAMERAVQPAKPIRAIMAS
jgi:hypothetical protein